jgi:uncharacterized protein (DUF697 family)
MLDKVLALFHRPGNEADRQWSAEREKLLEAAPVPLFWLLGKAQSGKTSLVRVLTGANDAEIGNGYRPMTKSSRQYDFPSNETPLLRFLDTRGLGEAGYDPESDVKQFVSQAHVIVLTIRALDHAQEPVLATIRRIRVARPEIPVLLAITCLHEAYPNQPHPKPDPFAAQSEAPQTLERPAEMSAALFRLSAAIAEHRKQFAGLFDQEVEIDFTSPDEGFDPPDLGKNRLQRALVDMLPAAYRQALTSLTSTMDALRDAQERKAQPYILSASSLAAVAAAVPVPWVDLPLVAAIQTRLVFQLGDLYGQPTGTRRFLELAGAVGSGLIARQAVRELLKVVPGVGALAGAALAYAATYALGKACCWYFGAVKAGNVPTRAEIQKVYREQLALAERLFQSTAKPAPAPAH